MNASFGADPEVLAAPRLLVGLVGVGVHAMRNVERVEYSDSISSPNRDIASGTAPDSEEVLDHHRRRRVVVDRHPGAGVELLHHLGLQNPDVHQRHHQDVGQVLRRREMTWRVRRVLVPEVPPESGQHLDAVLPDDRGALEPVEAEIATSQPASFSSGRTARSGSRSPSEPRERSSARVACGITSVASVAFKITGSQRTKPPPEPRSLPPPDLLRLMVQPLKFSPLHRFASASMRGCGRGRR